MPAQEDGRPAGDLRRKSRVPEQHDEGRPRHETPQGRAGARAEIGPPFPRPRLGVH